MLPPPGTIASSTPASTTPRTACAIASTRSGSVPYSSRPISDSPESFSRTRLKTARLVTDGEPREAADHDVLTGRRGDLMLELADRLALVLVGVDVRLLEQHDLAVPLGELALGDLRADVLRLVGRLLLEDPQLGVADVVGHLLAADPARRGGGDVGGDVARERHEVVVARDEIGLAVDLDEHADLAVVVDVGRHRTLGGDALAAVLDALSLLDAQELDRLVDVA